MSSYRMQPMLHMSTPWSYSFSIRMISGDLNHLELTWLDRHLYFLAFLTPSFYVSFSCVLLARLSGRDLASPKSQNFTWQKRLMRMFAGFKSLWMTLAEARNLPAHSMLYRTVLTCYYPKDRLAPHFMNCLRSDSSLSRTRKTSFRFDGLESWGVMMSRSYGKKQLFLFLETSSRPLIIWISRINLQQS